MRSILRAGISWRPWLVWLSASPGASPRSTAVATVSRIAPRAAASCWRGRPDRLSLPTRPRPLTLPTFLQPGQGFDRQFPGSFPAVPPRSTRTVPATSARHVARRPDRGASGPSREHPPSRKHAARHSDGAPHILIDVALTDEAIERIKEMIVSGELKPGERLPKEDDLAAPPALSPTPLRECGRAPART